jgi:hypothetical protein
LRDQTVLCFLGHHKCASTWVSDVVRDLAAAVGLACGVVHDASIGAAELAALVDRHRLAVRGWTNARSDGLAALRPYRGFHVVRDPRDVCVSAYYSHLASHPLTPDWPELARIRELLSGLDKDEGLLFEIGYLNGVFQAMASFSPCDPDVLEVKMEDLVDDPGAGFVEICRFLGLCGPKASVAGPVARLVRTLEGRARRALGLRRATGRLAPEEVRRIVRRHGFAEKTRGRPRGVEDLQSHYRSGVAGDWQRHFGPRHREEFERRYGELLVRLGYLAPDGERVTGA